MKKMISQTDAPLYRAARRFLRRGVRSFHVPLHGRGAGAYWLKGTGLDPYLRWDLTELDTLDDLHLPREAIKRAQNLAADLFGAERTFFLVNGVTGGLLALFMAFTASGSKVMLTRLSHKAAMHGIILSGAHPVYLPVEKASATGFPLNVSPETVERALQENSDTTLVLVTSPSYWGVAADLPAIRKVTEKFGVMLAVDEAHGTHLPFYGGRLPHSGAAGADLWLQSAHKSLGALTPGAYLHLREGARQEQIRFWLQALQTSSPSYPVMISLDLTRRQMALQGRRLFSLLWDWGMNLRKELRRKGFQILSTEEVEKAGFFLDPCRITLLFPHGGGRQFSGALAARGCHVELATDSYLLAIAGPSQLSYPRRSFIKSLQESRSATNPREKTPSLLIKDEFSPALFAHSSATQMSSSRTKEFVPFPLTPQEALSSPKSFVPLEAAQDKICAEMAIQSPPGIPVLVPGEVITKEVLDFLLKKREAGVIFQGARDAALNKIGIVGQA